MASRLQLTVTFKGKNYAGEYEVDGSLVHVFFEDQNKATKLNNSSNPEFVACLLLIELVCGV